jgi:hypothetical protein
MRKIGMNQHPNSLVEPCPMRILIANQREDQPDVILTVEIGQSREQM